MVSGGAGDLINTESSGQPLSHLAITITIVSTHKGLTWERYFLLLTLFLHSSFSDKSLLLV